MTPKVELATFKDYTTDLYGFRHGDKELQENMRKDTDDPIKITKILDNCLFGYLCNLLLPLFLSLKKKLGIYVENLAFICSEGKAFVLQDSVVSFCFLCVSAPHASSSLPSAYMLPCKVIVLGFVRGYWC